MSTVSILLLQGDAEAQLLADAESAVQAVLPHQEVRLSAAWTTRPDWLDPAAPGPPDALCRCGLICGQDPRDLLSQPHRLVIFPLLPAVVRPAWRHRSGGVFVLHRGLLARWSQEEAARIAAECSEEPPLPPAAAAAALEPVIRRLQERGTAVAVCTAFRHVREPLDHRPGDGPPALRELVRQTNLEAARLSQRSGCFVLDLDRPLAQEGAAALEADCFGGGPRAAAAALDELAALVLDALPDEAIPEAA